MTLYRHSKHQFIPLITLWDIVNLKVMLPGSPHPFLATLTSIFFYRLLVSDINKQKIRLNHQFSLEIYLIKNPAIWLAKSRLAQNDWEINYRFTAFTFSWKNKREVVKMKNKNKKIDSNIMKSYYSYMVLE